MNILINIFLIILFLLILDGLWLNLFMIKKYKTIVYDIQGKELRPKYIPIVLFYLIYSISIYYLILENSKNLTDKEVFIKGFILGICAYATYDLTNLAIFEKFDYKIAILDVLWGGLYTAVTCLIVKKIIY